jgi:hypothetical protein
MLLRPLLVACVIGTTLAIASTGSVSLGLVATTTLSWSFVVGVQLIAAFVIIGTAPARTMAVPQAVDAFFALHVPWSSWMLAWATWTWMASPAWRHSDWVLVTALAPAGWTAFLVYRYCRDVLGEPHHRAVARTSMHQAMVWGAVAFIGGAAVGLWPRILRVLGYG